MVVSANSGRAAGAPAATSLLASQEFLACPELLCLLLMQMDKRNLLTTAQRVCKSWHSQIHSSPSLCRLLFLPSRSSQEHGRDSIEGPVQCNPWIETIFPDWLAPRPEAIAGSPERYVEEDEMTLTEMDSQLEMTAIYRLRNTQHHPFLRPGSSWLHMHISHPPTTKLIMHRESFGSLGPKAHRFGEFYYPEGIRMGQLYAIRLAAIYTTQVGSEMGMRWPCPAIPSLQSCSETSNSTESGIVRNVFYGLDEQACQEAINAAGSHLLIKVSSFEGCASVVRPLEKPMLQDSGISFFRKEFARDMTPVENLDENIVSLREALRVAKELDLE